MTRRRRVTVEYCILAMHLPPRYLNCPSPWSVMMLVGDAAADVDACVVYCSEVPLETTWPRTSSNT